MDIKDIENLDEYFDYETILQRMLSKVTTQVDKREGSIIYDAIAPAAAELSQMYITLKYNIDLVFVDTAPGEYLDRLANQVGITRKKATYSIMKAVFYDNENNLMDLNIGERFSIEDLIFKITDKISTGTYKVQCEIPGVIGNNYVGTMIPVNYIDGLAKAELTEILIPGEDIETDELLRARIMEKTTEKAFAGNIADYKKKTNEIDGVGAVKVIPVWNGGGTVKLIILDSNYNKASSVLIDKVQQEICPNKEPLGLGLAPIGHKVTVTTPEELSINISVQIQYTEGESETIVKPKIIEALKKYFLELREKWETTETTIVRISQIENIILNTEGVLDITQTSINSSSSNIEIEGTKIPIIGEVNIL